MGFATVPRSFPISTANFQFSLRWLFVLVSAAAVIALVARVSGGIEAAGTVLSLILFGVCLRLRGFRWVGLVRGVLVMLSILVLWFAAIDYSVTCIWCDRCNVDWAEGQIRFYRTPLWTWRSRPSQVVASQIAEDLGVPCAHQLQDFQKYRFWGLLVPYPAHSGTWGLADPKISWYDETMRRRVRQLAETNPQLGQEFHDKVLVSHDLQYLRKFMSDLKDMDNP